MPTTIWCQKCLHWNNLQDNNNPLLKSWKNNKISHTAGTSSTFQSKNHSKRPLIYTPKTDIHDRSLSWLGTGAAMKNCGLKLFVWKHLLKGKPWQYDHHKSWDYSLQLEILRIGCYWNNNSDRLLTAHRLIKMEVNGWFYDQYRVVKYRRYIRAKWRSRYI